jgi:DNA-binding response OmpR family regulator
MSRLILVVDRNAGTRSRVASLLERTGYETRQAQNGREALDAASQVQPALVLLDVNLPEVSGYEVCRDLRDRYGSDIAIIFLSGDRTEPYDRVAGLLVGADDYIVKPFDMRELEVRVENLIASRRKLRERFSGLQADIKTIHDSTSAADRAFVERLKAAVEASVSDPDFGVGELANAVFLDRSHLFRRTKELLNETPSDLLRRVRLERSASLLKESEGGVAEIAYACGFNSVSQFCRSFRVAYDATPSEYRTRNAAPTGLQPAR